MNGALLGEVWRIGPEVEVMVRAPRIPCITFQHRMQIPRWVKRFHQAGRPGAYLKVLRTGSIGAGDPIEVIGRPDHEVTVAHMFGDQDPVKLRRMLDSGVDLMGEIRANAQRIAARA
ncbi:MOSC domain-containing protein YiiM [Kribbella aluminosa]|uniref:MOSC domain-containing protein YiiM n=1 Tax=Kribbella aluminosa TaxID=416017 RepID=A0ABS4UXW3_9ACTN|nr:MOSC domain-containing protein YiiM [Kribbella aluminosa]